MKKVLVALTLMFAVSSVNLYACESCAKHNKDKKECSSKKSAKSEKECADAKAKGCAEGAKETKSCCSKKAVDTEKK